MKTVLITGASGFLGSNLVKYFVGNTEFNVIAADIKNEIFINESNVKVLNNKDLLKYDSLFADFMINCAFARENNVAQLVSALSFNEQLIQKCKKWNIGFVVNISSQGIYKPLLVGQLANEESIIEPVEMYGFAKYAQEKMFTSNFGDKVINIRMASLSANARFLSFFIDNVIKGKTITITAPNQYVSMIDISDAVCGIVKICDIPWNVRKNIYNLGVGSQYSILQIAELVNQISIEYGYKPVDIEIKDDGKQFAVGMDSTRLMNDTSWRPQIGIKEMIEILFQQRNLVKRNNKIFNSYEIREEYVCP